MAKGIRKPKSVKDARIYWMVRMTVVDNSEVKQTNLYSNKCVHA